MGPRGARASTITLESRRTRRAPLTGDLLDGFPHERCGCTMAADAPANTLPERSRSDRARIATQRRGVGGFQWRAPRAPARTEDRPTERASAKASARGDHVEVNALSRWPVQPGRFSVAHGAGRVPRRHRGTRRGGKIAEVQAKGYSPPPSRGRPCSLLRGGWAKACPPARPAAAKRFVHKERRGGREERHRRSASLSPRGHPGRWSRDTALGAPAVYEQRTGHRLAIGKATAARGRTVTKAPGREPSPAGVHAARRSCSRLVLLKAVSRPVHRIGASAQPARATGHFIFIPAEARHGGR